VQTEQEGFWIIASASLKKLSLARRAVAELSNSKAVSDGIINPFHMPI
jgi:hypothetical protein